MADFPRRFAASVTLPNTPPTIVQAAIELPSGNWSLTFDQRLRTGTLPANNLAFRLNNTTVTHSAGIVSGFTVSGTAGIAGGPPQADEADYQVVSKKILGWRGVPATPFTGQVLLTV